MKDYNIINDEKLLQDFHSLDYYSKKEIMELLEIAVERAKHEKKETYKHIFSVVK